MQHKKPVHILLSLCWLLSCCCAFAQSFNDKYTVRRYTETDGLVSSDLGNIYKDHKGFMWISTFAGLSRYDGHQFVNYDRRNGLAESNVNVTGEDEAGQIYLSTASNIYTYTGNSILPFRAFYQSNTVIRQTIPDKKDRVWAMLYESKGVYAISPKGIVAHIPTDEEVSDMIKSSDGNVYVLENTGLVSIIVNGKLKPVMLLNCSNGEQERSIRKDTKGYIWGYGCGTGYFYKFIAGALADSVAVPFNTDCSRWSAGTKDRFFQLTSSNQLYKLKNGAWQNILNPDIIKGDVYQVYEDETNIIWVTAGSGLYKVTQNKYDHIPSGSPLNYFTADATFNYSLRTDSALFKIPGAVNAFEKLNNRSLNQVYIDKAKNVWYANESALYLLPFGKTLKRFDISQTGMDSTYFRFKRVLEDRSGGIYFSTYHGILYWKNNKLTWLYRNEGVEEDALYTMVLDKQNRLYVSGNKIYVLINNRFRNISAELNAIYDITRLSADRNNDIWFCNGDSKVIKIGQHADGRFYRADSISLAENDLPFLATSVAFDNHNNMWICDNTKLFCYPYINNGYDRKKNPAVFNEQFTDNPLLFADESGHLQIVSPLKGGNYIKTYDADELLKENAGKALSVSFTAVEVLRKSFNWAGEGYKTNEIGVPVDPVLKHDMNFLRFSFSGISSDYNAPVFYRYMLQGYDNDWSPVSEKGSAEYTGLPPGDYIMKAQAKGIEEQWSEPALFAFTIKPVWYATLWARALWILLAMMLITSIFLLRVRSVQKKARTEKLISEEQLKALRAQINPHFLQNTFTFLAYEMAKVNNTHAIKSIDKLSTYLRNVLRYSDKTAMSLEEELDFSVEYLELQKEILSIPFSYEIIVDDEADTFDTQVPAMLFQPVLENALKYGIAEGKENVIRISIEQITGYIKCSISDTGNPFTATIRKADSSGKGNSLTAGRLDLFYNAYRNKSEFTTTKNIEGGTTVTILIPVL